MGRCCVPGCKTDGSTTVHRFPRETLGDEVFKEWIKRIGRPNFSTLLREQVYKNYVVCEQHFLQCCKSPGQSRLKPYSVPTVNVPNFQSKPTIANSFLYPESQKETSESALPSEEKPDMVSSNEPNENLGDNQNSDDEKDESSTTNTRTEEVPMPVQKFSKIICRLCLSTKVTLIKIFSFSSKLEQSIADALKNCVSINVNEQDEMPKYICKECYKQLVKTYNFRKKAAVSEKILWRHLQPSHTERSVMLSKKCPETKVDDKRTKIDGNSGTPHTSSKDNLAVIQDSTSKSNNDSSGETALGLTHSIVTFKRPETKVNRKYETPATETKEERKVDFAKSISIKKTKVATGSSPKKIIFDSNEPVRNDKTENIGSAICCEKTVLSLEGTKTRELNTKPLVILNRTKQLYQCNVCKKCFLHQATLKSHMLVHITETSIVLD